MNRTQILTSLIGAAVVGLTALAINAAVDSPRSLMAPIDYGAAKRAIEADGRLALGRCRDLEDRPREVCRVEARANERVRKADLEAKYLGTVAAASEAKLARAQAAFDVAKARCAETRGENRISCLRSARSEKAKALSDSRLASI